MNSPRPRHQPTGRRRQPNGRWLPGFVCVLLACAALVASGREEDDHPASRAPKTGATGMEELVVTADYRNTALAELPGSVAVLQVKDIRQYDAGHLGDLLDQVANVNYAGGTSRPRFYQIRGIGERSQFAAPLNPSVGLIIDGIDMSGLGSAATLFDVGQIEVLRGPQGTRYGANALAGLINIRSLPATAGSAHFRATLGQYDTASLGLGLSGPLTKRSSARFSVNRHRSDGYTENTFLGRDDTEAQDELSVHARVETDFGGQQLKLSGFFVDIDNGYDAFSFDNTRNTLSDQPGFDRQISLAVAGQLDTSIAGKRLELLATAARHDQDYGYDEDWTYEGFHPDGYSSTDAYLRDRLAYSLEARLLAPDEATRPWVAGIYHYDSREDLKRIYTFLPDSFRSDYDFRTTALFAQTELPLGESLTLEAGLRLEHRATRYRNSDDIGFTPNHLMWGGRLALTRQLPELGMAYLSIAQGFKAGGFNQDGTLPPELRSFDSEYLRELEVGAHLFLLDERLRLSLAAFHDWRVDQQVRSSRVTQRPDGSTEFVDFLGNAAEGRNYGLEVEAEAEAGPWRLTLSGGLLRTRFLNFVNEFGEDLSGRDQAHAPEYQLAFNLTRRLGEHWQLGAGFVAGDDFYLSDRHPEQGNSRFLTRARLSWRQGRVRVTLWGRNLGDQDVIVRGFGSFGNDPRNGYQTRPYYQYGTPRLFGLTLRVES